MAIGYHKINTSAARAKRRAPRENVEQQRCVMVAGTKIHCPTYGDGVTLEDFIADSDLCRVQFPVGVVVLRGGAVRVLCRASV